MAPLRGGCAILDSPRQTARSSEQSAGLSKRVKAKEREARALTRLVKPMTIETGFCVNGTITKSCHRPLCPIGTSAIWSVCDMRQPAFNALSQNPHQGRTSPVAATLALASPRFGGHSIKTGAAT
ncbi:MAG: hypothetical protein RLZZ157_261 [Pseudomonadota bacterium]